MNLQGSIVEGNGRITFPAWKYLDQKENRKGMQDSEGFGPFLHSHGMHLSCLTCVVNLEGKNGRLRETMGAKFAIFLVALLCNIAAHHSDVIRKLGWSSSGHSGIPQLIKVQKKWNYCRKELKDRGEAVILQDLDLSRSTRDSSNGVEYDSTSLLRKILQNAVAELPPNKKERILHCLTEENLPLGTLNNEREIWSDKFIKLFSSWGSIPRRYLRYKVSKHRVSGTLPSPAPALSPGNAPSLAPENTPSLAPALSSGTPAPALSPGDSPSLAPALPPVNAPSLKPASLPGKSPSLKPAVLPGKAPSLKPTLLPGKAPSLKPVSLPRKVPSLKPVSLPRKVPSLKPALLPGKAPSLKPVSLPRKVPSLKPALLPGKAPSFKHSLLPGKAPSLKPSLLPGKAPYLKPALLPRKSPSPSLKPALPRKSPSPSLKPALLPRKYPSPSFKPALLPREAPSLKPALLPRKAPSLKPALLPGKTPSLKPALLPGKAPSLKPALLPGNAPSLAPALSPVDSASLAPTLSPGNAPSLAPSPENGLSLAPALSSGNAPSVAPALLPGNTRSPAPALSPGNAPSPKPAMQEVLAPSPNFKPAARRHHGSEITPSPVPESPPPDNIAKAPTYEEVPTPALSPNSHASPKQSPASALPVPPETASPPPLGNDQSPGTLPENSKNSNNSGAKNNDSPNPSQEDGVYHKYYVAAAVTCSVAAVSVLVSCLVYNPKRRADPNDGQRDDNILVKLNLSNTSTGSALNLQPVGTSKNTDFEAHSSDGNSLVVESHSVGASIESDQKPVALPPPPGKAVPPPPGKTPPPPPHPPKSPAPAPPPPPSKVGRAPPNPPPIAPGTHHRRSSIEEGNEHSDQSDAPRTKLKPFFWDKVAASPSRSMVWHDIKAGSFQLDEEMMEDLFGCATAVSTQNPNKKDLSPLETTPQFIQIIDPKKSQNLAILLKASGLTTDDICDDLREGNELPAELCQTLLRMAPTSDEELKLRVYNGDISLLGPAERFLKVLIDIPFVFQRLEALLFINTFEEEFPILKESFAVLEQACTELKNSRLFLKLLEAVLKTGNRMNDGTFRGGAIAFKLDTLLKLSDVKGTDGKTTLLHFVVHEIILSEGARASKRIIESQNTSSMGIEGLAEDNSQNLEEYHRSLGLQVISGLGNELQHVKKAAAIDSQRISATVSKLCQSVAKTKEFLETDMKSTKEKSEFYESLTNVANQYEADIKWLMSEEKRIMEMVKSTGDYFHGKAVKDEGLRLFEIVKDFLSMLDKACNDVKVSSKGLPNAAKKESTPSSSSSAMTHGESVMDMHQRLFPAMRARQIDDNFSSDDES